MEVQRLTTRWRPPGSPGSFVDDFDQLATIRGAERETPRPERRTVV